MARVMSCHLSPFLFLTTAALLSCGFVVGPSSGFAAQSPEVRAMVDRAVQFLETTKEEENRFGGKSVVGLALFKAGQPAGHPKIVEAVKEVQAKAQGIRNGAEDNIVYGAGVSLIFLVSLDAEKYRSEIETLLGYLLSIQKPHGGWGYLQKGTGDTSMTQYGVLGAWEAAQAGIPVREDAVRRVAEWLVRTQDPNGGFGYQGVVSQTNAAVRQKDVRLSTSVAGLGSLYMCADLLDLGHPNQKTEGGRPPALEIVEEPGSSRVKLAALAQAAVNGQTAGNRSVQNNYRISVERQVGTETNWTYYYLYSLERYWSLREAVEGRSGASSKWYLDGVQYLKRNQGANGSWDSNDHCGVQCDTAFGILFLVRSMKKSIEKARTLRAGTLIGGRGLPKDSDVISIREGNVVSMPAMKAVEKVLAAVGEDDDPEKFETIEALAQMSEEDATPLIDKNAEKLRKLASGRSPEARLAAVRVLAKRRSMDDVPVLIYVLTDPDPLVVLEARNGLRRISRKFNGFGLPDDFNDAQRRTAIVKWKEWYLAVRPDAEFQ